MWRFTPAAGNLIVGDVAQGNCDLAERKNRARTCTVYIFFFLFFIYNRDVNSSLSKPTIRSRRDEGSDDETLRFCGRQLANHYAPDEKLTEASRCLDEEGFTSISRERRLVPPCVSDVTAPNKNNPTVRVRVDTCARRGRECFIIGALIKPRGKQHPSATAISSPSVPPPKTLDETSVNFSLSFFALSTRTRERKVRLSTRAGALAAVVSRKLCLKSRVSRWEI